MMRGCIALLTAVLTAASAAAAPAASKAPAVAPPTYAAPAPLALQKLAPPATAAAPCGDEMTIIDATPLQFGRILVEHDAGGVVTISPIGTAATLGSVAVGPDAMSATVRICGAPNEEFLMRVEPGHIVLVGTDIGARPHLVHDLEATATGAQLRPTGDGEWQGVLGARGAAEIHVGGSLTIPARQDSGTFAARFQVRIDKLR